MSEIISHRPSDVRLDQAVAAIKGRVSGTQELSPAQRQELNDIVDQLCEFELGRFLLKNQGGLNGEWTHRIISHPEEGVAELHPLESFIIFRSPTVRATRERFYAFQELLQDRVHNGCHLASLPCGVMADLLTLNFGSVSDFSLTGIDLDESAFPLARSLAARYQLQQHCHWIKEDAWNLELNHQFDVLTSNGLNIYQSDRTLLVRLYQKFRQALKPGGTLITSFLSPPPGNNGHTEWNLDAINMDDLQLQLKVMGSVLQATWACFQTEEDTRAQLQEAGFEDIEITWGTSRMFPTVCAR